MKKYIKFCIVTVIALGLLIGCASKRQASINVNPEGNVKFQEYNISILTPSVDAENLGTYLILKSEAEKTNARAEAIRAETNFRNAVMANPEKYRGVELPISLYGDSDTAAGNLRSVYVFNISSQKILNVAIAGATVKNQPGETMASISYGEKNGEVFLVDDEETVLYAYTMSGKLFQGPKKNYIPRKRMQAINWDGQAYDLIMGISDPRYRRNYRYSYR